MKSLAPTGSDQGAATAETCAYSRAVGKCPTTNEFSHRAFKAGRRQNSQPQKCVSPRVLKCSPLMPVRGLRVTTAGDDQELGGTSGLIEKTARNIEISNDSHVRKEFDCTAYTLADADRDGFVGLLPSNSISAMRSIGGRGNSWSALAGRAWSTLHIWPASYSCRGRQAAPARRIHGADVSLIKRPLVGGSWPKQ